jgi:Tol biopolymer transport system component
VSLVLTTSAGATFSGLNGSIAFAADGQIWAISANGETQTIAANLCADNVAWSPDGKKMAFDSGGGGCGSPSSIFLMNADGSHPRTLTDSGCGDVQPAWSPDGAQLVFRRTPGPNGITPLCNNELWTVKANGRGERQLTNAGANANAAYPSWSPDGSKIAFSRFNPTRQIFVLDLSTRIETDIDRTGGTYADSDLDWSPDGTKIAFIRSVPGLGNEVALMDADGSNQAILTNLPGNGAVDTVWSPDGSKLAFVQAVQPQGIYTMNPDGTDVVSVGTGMVGRLSWQPCQRKCR